MPKNTIQETEQLTDAMYYIMLSLVEQRHGYAIMKYIAELSNQTICIGPGTLYTLLKKLSNADWIIQISSDERTKTYQITETGLHILRTEIKRRRYMVEDGLRVLREAGYEE